MPPAAGGGHIKGRRRAFRIYVRRRAGMDRKRSERDAEEQVEEAEEVEEDDDGTKYVVGKDDIVLWIYAHPQDFDTRKKLKDTLMLLLHDAFGNKIDSEHVVSQAFNEAARHESPLPLLFLTFGLYYYERALVEPTLLQLCHPERLEHIMPNPYFKQYGREHMRPTYSDGEDARAGLGALDRGVMNEGLAAYLNFFTGDASTSATSLTEEEAARVPDRVSMEVLKFMTELMISYRMPGQTARTTQRAASKIEEATRAIEALTIGIYAPIGNLPPPQAEDE